MNNGPLSLEEKTAVAEMARQLGWRLVVLFGSQARDGEGRDIDLAVLPASDAGLMEQGGWQAGLEGLFDPRPVDLVLLQNALSPLARFEVFRDGECLYEAHRGLFGREQDRAFFLYADSEKFRRVSREILRG